MTDRMPLADLRDKVVLPACAVLSVLSGRDLASRDAIRFLLTATLQEDYYQMRRQRGARSRVEPLPDFVGAYGLWQIECATVRLIQRNPTVTNIPAIGVLLATSTAEALCIEMKLPSGDILAAILARLLLLCDPYAVPSTEQAAYVCYDGRTWRPGRKRPDAWAASWQAATEATEHL